MMKGQTYLDMLKKSLKDLIRENDLRMEWYKETEQKIIHLKEAIAILENNQKEIAQCSKEKPMK